MTFVHASPDLAGELFRESPQTGPSRERIEAGDEVLRDAARAAAELGIPSELELIGENGKDVASAILGVADGIPADLIVVGSRGLGPITGALLGGVSAEILAGADVPVLVAHAKRG